MDVGIHVRCENPRAPLVVGNGPQVMECLEARSGVRQEQKAEA